jgi:hypothetical protein
MLDGVLEKRSIHRPGVIVTNYDTGLMKAIQDVFPDNSKPSLSLVYQQKYISIWTIV